MPRTRNTSNIQLMISTNVTFSKDQMCGNIVKCVICVCLCVDKIWGHRSMHAPPMAYVVYVLSKINVDTAETPFFPFSSCSFCVEVPSMLNEFLTPPLFLPVLRDSVCHALLSIAWGKPATKRCMKQARC